MSESPKDQRGRRLIKVPPELIINPTEPAPSAVPPVPAPMPEPQAVLSPAPVELTAPFESQSQLLEPQAPVSLLEESATGLYSTDTLDFEAPTAAFLELSSFAKEKMGASYDEAAHTYAEPAPSFEQRADLT